MYINLFILLNISCYLQKVPDLPIIVIDTFGKEILDEPKIPAYMSIIYHTNDNINYYSDLSYYYKSNIGIEMRGHSSQDLFPKKQYGLETRNADGDNLSISLFDMPAVKDWILYAPFSDKLLMMNLIAVD